jgi:hypothetical protein
MTTPRESGATTEGFGAHMKPWRPGHGIPVWGWWVIGGGIACMVIVSIATIAVLVAFVNTTSQQATPIHQGAPERAAAASPVMVTAFTWMGGGAGNEMRDSAPFTLQGGHQVCTVAATALAGKYSRPSLGWYVRPADGRHGVEVIEPASFGTTTCDLYLPRGRYYLSSNTIDCMWSLAISEAR